MPKSNLHPRYCPWCKTPSGDHAELGMRDRVYHCADCTSQFLGAAWPGFCPACQAPSGKTRLIRQLDKDEPIPGNLCPSCQTKSESMAKSVAEGGVMFRCKQCHAQGVIEADVPFAKDIRMKTGKPAPEEVGVEIEDCPNCKPEDPIEHVQGNVDPLADPNVSDKAQDEP